MLCANESAKKIAPDVLLTIFLVALAWHIENLGHNPVVFCRSEEQLRLAASLGESRW